MLRTVKGTLGKEKCTSVDYYERSRAGFQEGRCFIGQRGKRTFRHRDLKGYFVDKHMEKEFQEVLLLF